MLAECVVDGAESARCGHRRQVVLAESLAGAAHGALTQRQGGVVVSQKVQGVAVMGRRPECVRVIRAEDPFPSPVEFLGDDPVVVGVGGEAEVVDGAEDEAPVGVVLITPGAVASTWGLRWA